jgi:hypothetical protein
MHSLQRRAAHSNGRSGAKVCHACKLRCRSARGGANTRDQPLHFGLRRRRQRVEEGDVGRHMVAIGRIVRAAQALHLAKKRGGQPGSEDQRPAHPACPAAREIGTAGARRKRFRRQIRKTPKA